MKRTIKIGPVHWRFHQLLSSLTEVTTKYKKGATGEAILVLEKDFYEDDYPKKHTYEFRIRLKK